MKVLFALVNIQARKEKTYFKSGSIRNSWHNSGKLINSSLEMSFLWHNMPSLGSG